MKTHLLALALLAATPALAQKKTVPTAPTTRYELRGVVTYLFNKNLGNKPDAGAKAFVINSSLLKDKESELTDLETYLNNHDYVERTAGMMTVKPKLMKMPDEMTPAEKIEALEDEAVLTKKQIIENPSTVEVTADGSGVFVKKLIPGNYIVMIRSANRTRMNPVEVQGQLVIRRVIIKDDDKEVSANFNP